MSRYQTRSKTRIARYPAAYEQWKKNKPTMESDMIYVTRMTIAHKAYLTKMWNLRWVPHLHGIMKKEVDEFRGKSLPIIQKYTGQQDMFKTVSQRKVVLTLRGILNETIKMIDKFRVFWGLAPN
jgi:hypothetical protein